MNDICRGWDLYTKDNLKALKEDYNTNVFRIAMYTKEGGYIDNKDIYNDLIKDIDLVIDNDMYGILVDHDDESIYQGVKRMIDNEQLRLHYHEMSLERAEMFNIEKTMQEVYNVL